MTKPTLIIFAAANGSGKTTVAKLILPKLKIREFVNADNIAFGLSPLNPTGQAVAAGRLVAKRIEELTAKRESFAIETTLSGNTLYPKLQKAKELGYSIEMYYIFSHDAEINIRRVEERVKQGGHGVPADDIRRRYWRSLQNLMAHYAHICDKIHFYDTGMAKPTCFGFSAEIGRIDVYNDDLYMRFIGKLIEVKNEH